MDLDLNPWTLLAGLIFGVVGLYIFRIGKKNSNLHWVALGLILMIYPYLVSGAIFQWGTGIALCGLAYYFRNE